MNLIFSIILRTSVVCGFLPVAISGCVQFDVQDSLSEATLSTAGFVQGDLQLHQTKEQQDASRARAGELLSTTLDQTNAIELALVNSPAVQQMLASHWEDSSTIATTSGIPNPVFEFSRLSSDSLLEIERVLSIGLLDLVRLPMQRDNARRQLKDRQLQLTSEIINRVTEIRKAWVAAVVAQQNQHYAEQVFSSAEASAELAANMQSIGNFNAISRARQQAFYADAATGLTVSRHRALATREQLIRLLGLDLAQREELQLPNRLPDLPTEPVSFAEVTTTAAGSRLDVAMAVSRVESVSAQQGIKLLADATDLELALERNTEWSDGERESVRGYELGIEVPIFNGINQLRDRLNAQSLAAANALEQVTRAANSHLREAYSAYRSSYDIAKHYRDEVVPLQQMVSEENVLNYNGMLIGIFELLADSRKQIQTVQQSINAAGQYWMSEAALRASMIGNPTSSFVAMTTTGGESGGEDH